MYIDIYILICICQLQISFVLISGMYMTDVGLPTLDIHIAASIAFLPYHRK